MARVHAFGDDALADLDTVELVEHLARGKVSIPEVVDAAIARTQQVDGALNAVAAECFDRARSQATDPRGGFFAGVPTFVKDNSDLAGLPTRQGTDAFEPRAAKRDGDFARMFLATGVIPLGKTQLSEYGFSAVAEHPRIGPVRNPWSTAHTAGASSSGSAALVAAGAVTLAHANDGAGSIRIPAAVNGLVGLKPTRGRLAQDTMLRKMPVRVVADGVVTRSVRDTAAFLREAEKVYRDLSLAPIGDVTRPGRARRRVAVVTDGIGVTASPEVTDLTRQTADAGRVARSPRRVDRPAGAHVVPRRLPALLGPARLRHRRQWSARARPLVGQGQARRPHPGPRPSLPPQPRPRPRRDPPPAPLGRPDGRGRHVVRRRAHADPRHRDARGRLARPDAGLRPGDGAAAAVGRLHARPERCRGALGLAAPRDDSLGTAAGDDALRRPRP